MVTYSVDCSFICITQCQVIRGLERRPPEITNDTKIDHFSVFPDLPRLAKLSDNLIFLTKKVGERIVIVSP